MTKDDYHVDICRITIDNKVVAKIEHPAAKYPPVICGQHKVAEIILRHLGKYPHAKIT